MYAGTDASGKNVAIKMPQVKFDKTIDSFIYDKFQKEASVWSKLDHPNIVGFYSANDQPLPHIVMEMRDRGSLQTLMKKHGLIVGEAVHRKSHFIEDEATVSKNLEKMHSKKLQYYTILLNLYYLQISAL